MKPPQDPDTFPEMPFFGMAGRDGEDTARSFSFHNREELERMPREELLAYTETLQKICGQLDGENKFLDWEFRDVWKSLSYFSHAVKLAHQLNASDFDTIVSLAVAEVPLYFGCRYAELYLFNLETVHFDLRHSTRGDDHLWQCQARDAVLAKLFMSREEPYIAELDAAGKCVVFDDGDRYVCDIPEGWVDCFKGGMMVFPLRSKQQDRMEPLMLGGLLLGDSQKKLEARDAEAGMFFCDLLSSSLHNTQLLARLNDLTIIDPLTQIYNRRYLINQLNSAMIQARRQGHPLSVAMADIDNFKRFNDTYGHICGDEVLREVANILKTSIRAGIDVPARYGGEEFMLVMPFTSLELAVEVADRIRRSIENHKVRFEDMELSVTCSFGVAEYVPGEPLEKFINWADASLYQAKNAGRNRVCSAERGGD